MDEDRAGRYDYLTTWLGEHQNESDMAFYSTTPFDHMIGPGIGRVGSIVGPLLGALLLFASDASFTVVNIVAALVDALLSPLIAITTTYLYFDLRVRGTLAEQEQGRAEVLPSEI